MQANQTEATQHQGHGLGSDVAAIWFGCTVIGPLAVAGIVGLSASLHHLFPVDAVEGRGAPTECGTRGPACGDAGCTAAVRSLPDGNHGENN